ncbi:MAG: hypothetical protein JWO95_1014 [Verrucomicrobiales bacterium]|nr:hypothetical protein [Verrucomicrobiales bacterium]
MSELNFLQTGYLASLLLASLVLPVLLSALAPSGRTRIVSTRIVWAGQLFLGLVGGALLVWPTLAICSAICGIVVVMMCASALLCLRVTPARRKA